jgi:hypothetical protein
MGSLASNLYDSSEQAIVNATPTTPMMSIDRLKVDMVILKAGGYNYTVDHEAFVANDLVRRALNARK